MHKHKGFFNCVCVFSLFSFLRLQWGGDATATLKWATVLIGSWSVAMCSYWSVCSLADSWYVLILFIVMLTDRKWKVLITVGSMYNEQGCSSIWIFSSLSVSWTLAGIFCLVSKGVVVSRANLKICITKKIERKSVIYVGLFTMHSKIHVKAAFSGKDCGINVSNSTRSSLRLFILSGN